MTSEAFSIAPYHLRDLAEGIQQQMFFWGQDVAHPTGNILVKQGFERLSSLGLKGTSRYRRKWQGGHIELYGACAGWYGADRGFTFIRSRKRCVIWLSSESTPVPGAWEDQFIDKEATKEELYHASLPFLDWLLSYESTIPNQFGRAYREENHRKYSKVPKAKAWVEPDAALRWFQDFRHAPKKLLRPKKYSHKLYA